MRIALIIAAVLAVAIGIVLLIGWKLPVAHHVTLSRRLAATPHRVFSLIATPSEFPAWRSGVTSIELLPGTPLRYVEHSKDGVIRFVVTQLIADQRMVTRIDDRSLPFGGTWTYQLTADGDATWLEITEDGEVYNPLFRFVSRFVMGHTATIGKYLDDVEKVVP